VLLSVGNLSVQIEDRKILDGITFEIERGEWFGVIGPNGSGKTTLLRAINGFIPFHGTIRINNRILSEWKRRDLARVIAFVRQTHELSFEFQVRDIVLMGKTPHKRWLEPTTGRDLEDVDSALARVGLPSFGERNVLSLSGGELQRVFLAQALIQDADLLLLDEPTTHLDVFHQYDILEQVRRMTGDGKAAITVFHDLEQAWRYCDKIIVLDEGIQVACAPPADVLNTSLIKDVFKMDAALTQTNGVAGITYLRPAR
jgi:iron complex transport system ATP-binding protein